MLSEKVYKPRKTSPVLLIILFLLFLGSIGYSIYFHGFKNMNLISPLISLIFIAFFSYIYFAKKYILDAENLHIKMGFITDKKIPIASIKKIKEISRPFSKSATNIDIFYNKFDNTTISLRDKDQFIKDLLKINPAIEVKSRNEK